MSVSLGHLISVPGGTIFARGLYSLEFTMKCSFFLIFFSVSVIDGLSYDRDRSISLVS